MIFAFLFGLSMDYEVFILSRIREEYDQTGAPTRRGHRAGTHRPPGDVGALILFLAFISLASGPQTDIKVFATGLGFGILLDATVVRMLLVPALVSMFGEWNWYMPAALRGSCECRPAPPEPPSDGDRLTRGDRLRADVRSLGAPLRWSSAVGGTGGDCVGAEDPVERHAQTGRLGACDHRVRAQRGHLQPRRERRDRRHRDSQQAEEQVAAARTDAAAEHHELRIEHAATVATA